MELLHPTANSLSLKLTNSHTGNEVISILQKCGLVSLLNTSTPRNKKNVGRKRRSTDKEDASPVTRRKRQSLGEIVPVSQLELSDKEEMEDFSNYYVGEWAFFIIFTELRT